MCWFALFLSVSSVFVSATNLDTSRLVSNPNEQDQETQADNTTSVDLSYAGLLSLGHRAGGGGLGSSGSGGGGGGNDDDDTHFSLPAVSFVDPSNSVADEAHFQLGLLLDASRVSGAIWGVWSTLPALHLTSTSIGEWWTALHTEVHAVMKATLANNCLRLRGGGPKKVNDASGHAGESGTTFGWKYAVWDDGDRVSVGTAKSGDFKKWVFRLTTYADTSDVKACVEDQLQERGMRIPGPIPTVERTDEPDIQSELSDAPQPTTHAKAGHTPLSHQIDADSHGYTLRTEHRTMGRFDPGAFWTSADEGKHDGTRHDRTRPLGRHIHVCLPVGVRVWAVYMMGGAPWQASRMMSVARQWMSFACS